jgi:hypothetical protein
MTIKERATLWSYLSSFFFFLVFTYQHTRTYICFNIKEITVNLSGHELYLTNTDKLHFIPLRSLDRSVGTETGYRLDGQFSIPTRSKIFTFSMASRPALGPTQPPTLCVTGALTPGQKRSGRKANHSPPSGAEVKNLWNYTSTPSYVFITECLINYAQGKFYFLYFLENISITKTKFVSVV